MDEKALKTLEYDKILEQIALHAKSDAAKDEILALKPDLSRFLIEESFDMLSEATEMLKLKGALPLYGYKGIEKHVVHAQKGGMLRGEGCLAVASSLKTAKQLKRYLSDDNRDDSIFPRLLELSNQLSGLTALERDISGAVLSDTELSDNASPILYDIRRKIQATNSSVKDKLSSIITDPQSRKHLSDNIITIRNGRYVVPVRSDSKGNIAGIVHDASASGLTVFIEPAGVVSLNNRLRELEIEEAAEIDAIFRSFSKRIAQDAIELLHNEKVITFLDSSFAKAEFAYELNHTRPSITEEKKIVLYKATHPLIDKKNAVASDITLGGSYTQMIITGPNTGGKTVSLKTIGLCSLMAQSGLFIPALSGSTICLFDKIFADIGDEQSIAQSLSTFSAHMTNIVSILSKMNSNSLILLDELGAGTDPDEGAALAKAILTKIRKAGALCAATTHYSEIKRYALTTAGAVNASVEFDVAALRPTYRLSIGLPGKSNAFLISKRLGLEESVIDEAREMMDKHNAEFEDILSELTEKLSGANKALSEAKDELKKANELKAEAEKEKKEAEKLIEEANVKAALEGKKILKDAKEQAKMILSEADRYSALNPSEKNNHRQALEQISSEAIDQLNEKIPLHEIRKEGGKPTRYSFKKDDEVYIPSLKTNAIIIELSKDYAMIQAGIIKTRVPLSKLEPAVKKKEKSYSYTGMKSLSASNRLDIRGITANEVEIELEKFLDDAGLSGLKCVTVVHGKGEGILKKEVERALKNNPMVESFRSGGLNEGGSGATIVYLE